MDLMNLFVPITKVDVEKRLVYGTVAEEVADKSSEIMDYASAKPEFEKWSNEFAKATDGKSVGNLRAMHDNVAAGKLTTISFNDDAKKIEACGKVVDDNEWAKVLEGVYTGFSMGGKYAKRWKDEANPLLTRYTPVPSEVSLVDNPCIPTATFEVVKADGSTELRKFKAVDATDKTALAKNDAVFTATPRNPKPGLEQVWKSADGETFITRGEAETHNAELEAEKVAKAAAAPASAALAALDAVLSKKDAKEADPKKPYGDVDYADPGYQSDKKKRYPLDTEAHIRAAWNYINKKKNAGKYDADEAKKIKAKIVAAWKDKIDKDGPPEASDKAAMALNLSKGLYTISRAADLIEQLTWLRDSVISEEAFEADGSPAGKVLCDAVNTLLDWLGAYATEEVNEAKSGEDDDVDYEGDEYEIFELAVGIMGLEKSASLAKLFAGTATGKALEKAGARHSKKDMENIQKMHDASVQLGAGCDHANSKCDAQGADADGEGNSAEKLAKSLTDNQALQKVLAEITPKIEAAVAMIEEQGKEIATLKAQPAGGGPTRVVLKNGVAVADPAKAIEDGLEKMTPAQRAHFLMKAALKTPTGTAPEPLGKRAA